MKGVSFSEIDVKNSSVKMSPSDYGDPITENEKPSNIKPLLNKHSLQLVSMHKIIKLLPNSDGTFSPELKNKPFHFFNVTL